MLYTELQEQRKPSPNPGVHLASPSFDDVVYCPTSHDYENYSSYTGDEQPACEHCWHCGELFIHEELESLKLDW